jgi:hypothetical protein
LALSKEIGSDLIVEAVNLYLEMLKSQEATLKTLVSCSKPSDGAQYMINIAKENKKKIIALEKKDRKFMNHFRCIEDSVNIFAWY